MNYPKQINRVPNNRKAIAPYNFVELPDRAVEAEELPSDNKYDPNRNTGKIECTLTTSSPLYIRRGLTTDEFVREEEKKAKDCPDFFYTDKSKKPVIPGSSLRGMLRTLVEIISFSKLDKVSDEQRFFFRAVAAKKDDPLKYEYTDNLKNVRAGYLEENGDRWFIRPALEIKNKPFLWVEESLVEEELPELIPMRDLSNYKPQYFPDISFEGIQTEKLPESGKKISAENLRKFAKKFSNDSNEYEYKGVLVTSGNMMEVGTNSGRLTRKNHCIVREADATADLIPIDKNAIKDYRQALTPFQKEPPFDDKRGVLKSNRPIFYCEPETDEPIKMFGQSPNFRIPYIPNVPKEEGAATAVDFVPPELRFDGSKIIDIADAIFGWVRDEKQSEEIEQNRRGRINITDGICDKELKDVSMTEDFIIPKILASPKPTTFQHYLVQPEETYAEKKHLKHYASEPVEETVIRGHKLYWHKGEKPKIELEGEASDTQTTKIKPIKPGVVFKFDIHFENLTAVELSALMWVLDIAQDDAYRLKLGMGKPLGMGAVKIESKLLLSDRQKRYTTLFNGNNWETGETREQEPDYRELFENYILEKLQEEDDFQDIPRIKMLLAMLSWPGSKNIERTTRYMEIERKKLPRIGNDENEYKERPVLPTPLQIIESDRLTPN